MGKIIFILGGARSGKSTYALELAKKHKDVAFIATGQGLDREMKERIKLHKKSRPRHWQTFEEAKDVALMLASMDNKFDCIVIDCLTLLVSNLLLAKVNHKTIEAKIDRMLEHLRKKKGKAIIVSNEVGLGVVPANKLGRDFRDIAGRVNQVVAKEADEVYFMVSGIASKIKGKG
jgi:adenosylcobinamide kinase/adenosylcobinamide-phosphate guanylyltransferase